MAFDAPNRLPLTRVRAGARWIRIHSKRTNALWFGPAPGKTPIHRFDDPMGRFRVCYLGTTIEACFAETFLRNPPVRILSLADLADRSIASIELLRELRIVTMRGSHLARLGMTAEVAGGSAYDLSQAWSRTLWEHADQPDGIMSRSRQHDSSMSIALYDRAKDALAVRSDQPLTEDPILLARLLKRYGLGLSRD